MLSNIATVITRMFNAHPGEEWVAVMCSLCRVLLEYVRAHGSQEGQGTMVRGRLVLAAGAVSPAWACDAVQVPFRIPHVGEERTSAVLGEGSST